MNQPTVCAICLTADRPELAKRAVKCFKQQTYQAKRLFVLDTGETDFGIADGSGVYSEHYPPESNPPATIGALRNWANSWANDECLAGDIIVHWDDDDWSHPNRIAEQVALLESSGAEAVGYNEMLFWREGCAQTQGAWIYRGTILGTSLCYWRATWERRKFEATSYGEDTKWLQGVKSRGVSSIDCDPDSLDMTTRMVARIHGKNTSKAYDVKAMLAAPNHWTRTPHWDDYCRSVCE